MYCVNCGTKLGNEDCFCGKCGARTENIVEQKIDSPKIEVPKKEEPQVVYIEEKPMESILNNPSVIGLTLFFFMLSLITIIGISVITKDVPASSKLDVLPSFVLY